MNLRHFIRPDAKTSENVHDHDSPDEEITTDTEELDNRPQTYHYLPYHSDKVLGEKMIEEKKELQRIPTCAVFHKIAQGKGVPHTFIGESEFDC